LHRHDDRPAPAGREGRGTGVISHLRLSLASGDDAREISALSAIAVEHGLRQSWTTPRVLACIGHPETNVAVARDGAWLVGFGIMDYGEAEAHLALLAVREGARRQGVASALLAWLERSAVVAGIPTVRAEVRGGNAGARDFYRARGYREGERLPGYYQGVEDAVRLEKRLVA
jgi:ribosomal-protein-alanine N-acetyltransferase